MTIYALACLISTICIYLSANIKFKVGGGSLNKTVNNLLVFIAILVPILVAAFRDNSIGTDIAIYGLYMFNSAKSQSFYYFMTESYTTVEPLFKILVYLLAIFKNRYIFFGGIEAACIIPVFIMLLKQTPKKAWIGVAVYYFWLFGFSLNIMRQSIAISILLYGVGYLIKHDTKKYLLIVLIAMGFHYTAVVGIIIYLMNATLVYQPLGKKSLFGNFAKKYGKLFKFIVVFLLLLAVYYGALLIPLITTALGRYGEMALGINEKNSTGLGYLILVGCIFLISIWMSKIKKIYRAPESRFYSFMILCGIILFYLSAISGQMFRVSLYFTGYLIPYETYLFSEQKHKKYDVLLGLTIFCIAIIFIYHYYIQIGWNGIYPYIVYSN